MIEVEAKIKVCDLKSIRKKIKCMGKYKSKEKKIDDYYTLENINKYPKKSLRVRKKKNKYEINFKQRISYVNGIHAKNEQEFVVKNIHPFLDLINDFGFKKWLRKEKLSEIYSINKYFSIELNNVKKLGWFLEIEYLTNLNGIGIARKKIQEVIRKLGINKKQIIFDGYTKMLWGLKK